ncbi:MAG: hypothetical protein WD534_14685 [Phycisphaeraceae bacterium]
MRHHLAFAVIVLATVMPALADEPADPQVIEIEHQKPDEVQVDALGLKVHRFHITVPRGYMLNVELRYLDEEDKLDPLRSEGAWYLSSDGLDRHEIYIGEFDPDALQPNRRSLDLKLVSSEASPRWIKTWKSSGSWGYGFISPTRAGEDLRLFTRQFTRPDWMDDEEAAEPGLRHRMEQSLDDPDDIERAEVLRFELIVRAEPVTEEIRQRFWAVTTLPKSSATYRYSPAFDRRFFPWDERDDAEQQQDDADEADAGDE